MYSYLQQSVQELNIRGLRLASRWASEQLLGMCGSNAIMVPLSVFPNVSMRADEWNTVMFVNNIMLSGEYQRSSLYMRSAILQLNNSGVAVSAVTEFLYLYSLYMAGESMRDQQYCEDSKVDDKEEIKAQKAIDTTKSKNSSMNIPCLIEIFTELFGCYASSKYVQELRNIHTSAVSFESSAARGYSGVMDSFLLYLLGVVLKDISSTKLTNHVTANLLDNLSKFRLLFPHFEGDSIKAQLRNLSAPYYVLLQSVIDFPFNWSCWLELANVCIMLCNQCAQTTEGSSGSDLENEIARFVPFDETLLDAWWSGTELPETCTSTQKLVWALLQNVPGDYKEGFYVMAYCFLCHVYLEQHVGDKALHILQTKLLPVFPTSQVVKGNIAMAYYLLRDYNVAQECFELCREKDPYRIEFVDTYSNVLYVKEKRVELSYLAHAVTKICKFTPQACCVVGNYYSLKESHEKAVLYFRRATKLQRNYLSAWTLMGHEFMELKNTSAAVHCYREAITISPNDYRAWYGLGQTYEMLHLYQHALYYFKRSAALRPKDSRMWCAIGSCLYHMNVTLSGSGRGGGMNRFSSVFLEEVISVYLKALQCGDSEGIAIRELPKLYKELGMHEKAVAVYETYYLSDFMVRDRGSAAKRSQSAKSRYSIGSLSNSGVKGAVHSHSPRSTSVNNLPLFDGISNIDDTHTRSPFMTMPSFVSMDSILEGQEKRDLSMKGSNTSTPWRGREQASTLFSMDDSMPCAADSSVEMDDADCSRSPGGKTGVNDVSICTNPSDSLIKDLLNNKDKVDALVYVAKYYVSVGSYEKAERLCMLLLDFYGNEGNEARALLREIREACELR